MISTTLSRTIGVSLAAAVLTAFPSTAATRRSPDYPANAFVRQVDVRYGDLDLTSDAGATTMYDRLRTAAKTACGGVLDPLASLGQIGRIRKCRATALAGAVATLRAPLVTALYDTRHRGHFQLASR